MSVSVQAPSNRAEPVHATPQAQNDLLARLLAAVPDRPKLIDSIRLAGQMRESAFKDPPWLLERRDAGYIQVTHLLYLVAEACTGENSLEDIARQVSERSGRGVSADNVRQLIATQLLAKGLVALADGRVLPSAHTGGRSALQINLRTKEIPPHVLDPLTRVLSILYWPPVLGLLMLTAIAAEVWLYLVHGVGGSVHDALYKPGFMVVVLGITVISAGFHELGHAAALRYGGGQVRGMGAGMYLIYPAFYTDVSDNYRLTRWPRVRTDLGGFYFNLILSLGIFGVYLLTRLEALLLVVTLINFEIIHQLLPFLRLDGYWALADLTGVPDFFSQMGAFARSVVPGLRARGRKLPELKWWGKLVFAGYMLVTIPLLTVLLVLMVKSVPRVVATTWDALGQQAQSVVQAQGAGNFPLVAGSAAQALLLCLPLLGLTYTLVRLGRSGLALLYRWSRPSFARRVAGSAIGLGIVAGIVALWAPQLPFALFGSPRGIAVSEASYAPIAENERWTVSDALNDAVTLSTPASTPESTPRGLATPVSTSATALATTSATTTVTGTPATVSATPAAIAGTPTAGTPAATVATSVGTPGRAIGTSTPARAIGTPTPTLAPRRTPTATPLP